MKNCVIVFLLILGTSFSWGQDLKIVGGNEISLNTQNGGDENFIVTFKNTTKCVIEIISLRCGQAEIVLPKMTGDNRVEAGNKIKYNFRIEPKHSGKQRFQVYIHYESKGSEEKTWFTVKIDPKY